MTPPTAEPAQPLAGLLMLLELHREARQAPTAAALRYHFVNHTRRLVAYRRAALVTLVPSGAPSGAPSGRAVLEAVSNVAVPERDAPFGRWLEAAAGAVAAGPLGQRLHRVDAAALPAAVRRDWDEWESAHVLWCPLPAQGDVRAALWIARDDPWTEGELVLLERLADGYGHAWRALAGRRRGGPAGGRRRAAVLALVLAGGLAVPVPMSTLAPAEVRPREPTIVAAPLEGVIERFHVQPNQPVAAGQPLFSFESTVLRSRHEVARKALAQAETEHLTATQGAFADPQSKARVAQLKAQVEQRRAELAFAHDLLERVVVKAERQGIAVFADVNDWLGKPVAIGERILILADPAEPEIDIRVPVGDALVMEPGAEVSLFLNADPLHPRHGRLTHASYEAGPTPSGILAFRVKAELLPGEPAPRIGLRGTARILGERVPLALYLFRRPLAGLRQMLGL